MLTVGAVCVQSIDFFGALRARVYDDAVRLFLENTGFENMGSRLVNNREGVDFPIPAMELVRALSPAALPETLCFWGVFFSVPCSCFSGSLKMLVWMVCCCWFLLLVYVSAVPSVAGIDHIGAQ